MNCSFKSKGEEDALTGGGPLGGAVEQEALSLIIPEKSCGLGVLVIMTRLLLLGENI